MHDDNLRLEMSSLPRPYASRRVGARVHLPFSQCSLSASVGSAMRLDRVEAHARLTAHDHGILCTLHTTRGVDAVPAVFAADPDGYLGVPVDSVKPKASTRLQRERNLAIDPRATLLVEHWDRDDWSQLWWVRAELRWQRDLPDRESALADRLSERYVHYRDQPFSRVLVFEIVGVTGWDGSAD